MKFGNMHVPTITQTFHSDKKIEEMDQIQVSFQDLKRILQWGKENMEKVRSFRPVLETAVISVKERDETYIFDRIGSKEYQYTYHTEPFILYIFRALWDEKSQIYRFKKVYATKVTDIDFKEIENYVLRIHHTLMAYMEMHSQDREYVQAEPRETPTLQKRKGKQPKQKKKRSVVKIAPRMYVLRSPTKKPKKRKIRRVAEMWGVRGHYRKLKSGEMRWIRPYTKGKGKKQTKTYEL
ncbi:hypothetical protein [Thermoactinomyces sp. DSM 45892]|uniref:hypothetical protein n=1 Tax=Thermoactinomyces sp. DSM 45892 TaxID=1882753 RepID=UPI000897335D|nr:hypothetical protein [Thermoactinomyces sp. DSM 45892]SDZ06307.1 hypothetical protein SAMN05444416_112129 [Thermoactinomyces sp. DSM 45892]